MAYYKDYTESVKSQIVGLINERLSWDDDKSYKIIGEEDGVRIVSSCGLLTRSMLESVVPVAQAFGISYYVSDNNIEGKLEIRII